MNPQISAATDASFEQDVKLASWVQPVLVDFWAEWCGPCRMVAPILDQIADEHPGRLKVVKLDVDANPQTAAALGIRSIPTMILFRNGVPAATQTGAVPKSRLDAFVAPHLAAA
ncbi:MAG: thioredoxin [Sinimarinibacterium flocculans]|uniref:Thioredoxin n=1 Tax=Sinimarinibacterium flocculans TaxID=985250 RepID=A0A318E6U7_9GAMM|nr:thioredoxin [Sinimarinibacterium flocculans]MEC9365057.1 thioredoxin [Pseudomonadota bacterium]PXV67180.1 thioredoxin [Sinimarinibacterium flocculans]